MSAQNVYVDSVAGLPPSEQLRLASLILKRLAESADVLDYQDHWSAEDVRDLTAYSLVQAGDQLDEE